MAFYSGTIGMNISFTYKTQFKSSTIMIIFFILVKFWYFVIFEELFISLIFVGLSVKLLIFPHLFFNGCRICSDILFHTWYWSFIAFLSLFLLVLLVVFKFYWFFFQRTWFTLYLFSLCFVFSCLVSVVSALFLFLLF